MAKIFHQTQDYHFYIKMYVKNSNLAIQFLTPVRVNALSRTSGPEYKVQIIQRVSLQTVLRQPFHFFRGQRCSSSRRARPTAIAVPLYRPILDVARVGGGAAFNSNSARTCWVRHPNKL